MPKIMCILLSSFLVFSSCSNKKSDFVPVNAAGAPITIDDVLVDDNCVQVFYDKSTDPNFQFGRIYGLMLTNLLGHFPEYQQIIGPVELYKKGDIERCKATFYVGAYYDNALPADFLNDFKTTTRQAVWMGYNYWKLGTDFETLFGYHNYELTGLDYTNRDANNKPGFFRDVLYKGETFFKYNAWDASNPSQLNAAFEMTKLSGQTSNVSEILAQAKHSVNGEVIPWALKANNHFFVTEVPFAYMHEADRYLVFADLIFDFLKASPKHNAKLAVLRLEDIHPYSSQRYLKKAVNILKSNGIVPHISIVPIFSDPLYYIERDDHRPTIRMEEVPDFFALMQQYVSEGVVFIWHGITHQYKDIENPFSGISGDDYEFWNAIEHKPLDEDSPSYILDKFDDGFNSLKLAGIEPKLWVTPHYHSSPLDDVMFGQMFKWIIARTVYTDFKIGGVKELTSSKPLNFSLTDTSTAQNRRDFFSDLTVEGVSGFQYFGQIYPYELYGNIYGQNVIPENLGNVQPYLNEQVVGTRTVETMIEDARRNLVLRDVWASAFYHPFLLDPEENPTNQGKGNQQTDLAVLVKGIKNLGYTFTNLNTYTPPSGIVKGKPRIELEEIR